MAIEFSGANEHRSKCLKRLYLAELVDAYLRALSDAEHSALSLNIRSLPHRKGRGIVEEVIGKAGKRLASSIIAHFVDCLFPDTAESVLRERIESLKKARIEAV